MKQVYLDYNATTPVAPSVFEALEPYLKTHFGNPSSSHVIGRASAEAIEDARMHVAALLAVDREEIVFTAGGTDSNNLAIKGVMLADGKRGGHMIISTLEHPAVTEPAQFLQKLGCEVSVVPCDSSGVVDPRDVQAAIQPNTRMVSIIHANNEIGTIQPLREISEVCNRHSVLLHTDASQSTGKIRTFVDELGVDLLTIAGHKIYAPKGIGALYVREGIHLEPLLHGGDQENGMRGGTENTAFIVGLGQACKLANRCLDEAGERMSELRDRLYDRLCDGTGQNMTINGGAASRLPNTLSLQMPDCIGQELLARCSEVCASTGSACHAELAAISPTLAAIELNATQAAATLRLSVGWYTSEEDIDYAASLLIGAWESMHV
ncbi:MAG: cysteine desulfurase family protein [Pirellulaceae bacterium]